MQVVECGWLDWCNLIRMQTTTKYKIRTNYMAIWYPTSIGKVRRQHLCNHNQHTEGQTSKRERTKGKQWPTLESYSLSNRNPIKTGVRYRSPWWPVPQVAFIMAITTTTGHMSHIVTSHERSQMKWPAIRTNQTYQCSFVNQTR